jgi:hypothetical protein
MSYSIVINWKHFQDQDYDACFATSAQYGTGSAG